MLLGVLAVAVAVGGLVWFVRDEVRGLSADLAEIRALEEEADRHPFERPADGRIEEQRLVDFLEIRGRVFDVYAEYRDLLEGQQPEEPDLSTVRRAASMVGALRLALARARAEVGMSAEEYAFMVDQVYRAGRADPEGEAAARALIADLERRLSEAVDRGGLSEAQREELSAEIARARAGALDALAAREVPEANRALFERHRERIERYAMSGLEGVEP